MTIKILSEKYNNLQTLMGAKEEDFWIRDIDTLFSEDFTKKANGQFLVNSRSELQKQITLCVSQSGLWKIEEKEIIPSHDGKKCTNRYIISTEKAGSFEVIAIIYSKDGEKIDSIEEVFYQIV